MTRHHALAHTSGLCSSRPTGLLSPALLPQFFWFHSRYPSFFIKCCPWKYGLSSQTLRCYSQQIQSCPFRRNTTQNPASLSWLETTVKGYLMPELNQNINHAQKENQPCSWPALPSHLSLRRPPKPEREGKVQALPLGSHSHSSSHGPIKPIKAHKLWKHPSLYLPTFPFQRLGGKPASSCHACTMQTWRWLGGTGFQLPTDCSHKPEVPPEQPIPNASPPELPKSIPWRLDISLLTLGKCRNTARSKSSLIRREQIPLLI